MSMASNFDFRIGQTLGFLGVGTMNSAIIEGILKLHLSKNKLQHFSLPIYLSPRSKIKVDALKEKHGDHLIKVCKDNQDVLDNADVIFWGVRPEQVFAYYARMA